MADLSFDATKGIGQINALAAAFQKYNAAVTDVTVTQTKLSQSGNIASATIKGLLADGSTLTATIKAVGNQFQVLTGQIDQSTSALTRAKSAQQQLATLREQTSAKGFLDTRLRVDPSIDNVRKLALDRAAQKALSFVGTGPGNITYTQFQTLYNQIASGSKKTYTGIEEDARQAITRMIAEERRLTAAVAAEAARQVDITRRGQEARSVAAKVRGYAQSLPSNLTPEDRIRLDRINQYTLHLIKAGRLTEAEFDKVWAHVQNGATTHLKGIEETFRIVAQSAKREFEKLEQIGLRRSQIAQGKIDSTTVAGLVQSKYGQFTGLTTGSDAITRAIGRIREQFERGKISLVDFQRVLADTSNNAGKGFIGAERIIKQALLSIEAQYRKVEVAALKAAEAERNAARGQLATQQARALFDPRNPYPGRAGSLPTANISQLSVASQERIQRALITIQTLFERGKITSQEWGRAIEVVATNTGEKLTGGAEKARRALASIGQEIEKTKSGGTSFGEAIDRAFSFAKAQFFYSILTQITEKFKELVNEAANFERAIGLIQTLAQGEATTYTEWAEGIQKVSDLLGLPIAEVAQAGYDALSNQVVKAGDSFRFLTTAGEFARTTNSSIADSVNLLSSAINSYQSDTALANKISAEFFKTIDLGRVKAKDLESTFGRLATFGNTLGISREENLGAISTVSRQGIRADTTQTLLANFEQKLLNPTKELEDLYKKLGVTSGEEFVKTFGGLTGILEELQKAANGSKSRLAEFFNEIRGEQAVTILIARLQELKRDIAQISNPGQDYLGAKALTTENAGQKFREEIQKIENYFLDFYRIILKGTLEFTERWGGMGQVVKSLTPILYEVLGATTAVFAISKIIAWSKAISLSVGGVSSLSDALTAVNLRLTALSLNPYIIGFTALAAAIAYVAVRTYTANIEFQRMQGEIRKLAKEQTQLYKDEDAKYFAERTEKFQKAITNLQPLGLKPLADAKVIIDGLIESTEKGFQDAATITESAFEGITSSLSKSISDVQSEMNKLLGSAKDAKEFAKSLDRDYSRGKFDRESAKNDLNVSNETTFGGDLYGQQFDRSGELVGNQISSLQKLSEQLASSGDFEGAKDTFKEINGLYDRLAGLTTKIPVIGTRRNNQTGAIERYDTGQRYQIPRYNAEAQIKAEFDRQKSIALRVAEEKKAEAEQRREQLQVLRDQLKELEKAVAELKRLSGEKERSTPEGQRAFEDQAQRTLALADRSVRSTGLAQASLPEVDRDKDADYNQVTNVENLAKAHAAVNKEITSNDVHNAFVQRSKDIDDERNKLLANYEAAKLAAKELGDIEAEALAKVHGITEGAREKVLALSHNRASEFDPGTLSGAEPQAYQDFVNRNNVSVQEIAKALHPIGGQAPNLQEAKQKYQELLDRFDDLHQRALADKEEYEHKGDRGEADEGSLRDYTDVSDKIAIPQSPNGPERTNRQALQSIGFQIDHAQKLAEEARKKQEDYNKELTQLSLIAGATNALGLAQSALAEAAARGANGAIVELGRLNAQVLATIGSVRVLNAALEKSQADSREARERAGPAPAASTTETERWTGGSVGYFASGGLIGARGHDTQHIIADPEEYIVNRDSTRKFYSQLVAINKGEMPRSESGSNVDVGGITVHVQGGSNGKQTARDIVAGINREFKRGTVKLGR